VQVELRVKKIQQQRRW